MAEDNPKYLIEIVNCIMQYYKHFDTSDDSEDWKRKAGLITTTAVPEDLEIEVKKAFIKQLKKFV